MDRPRPLFSCSYPECNRSYRRKEHLNRHVASYHEALAADCPSCNRVFARNDTLRQHVRLHHKDAQLTLTRAIRACDYCRSRRSRCNGTAPCETCMQRGIPCSLMQLQRQDTRQHQQPHVPASSSSRRESHETGRLCLPAQLTERLSTIDKCPTHVMPFIEAYFDKFHPSWPFLHRATFDPTHEPPFLLQSVLMMGLWITNEHKTQRAAIELHEKLSLSIYQQRDKWEISEVDFQSQTSWPIATYQGILLQIIFALLQDNQSHFLIPLTRKLPKLPSALLTSLVHTCLRQTLFFYPTIVAQFTPGTVPDVFIWIGIEEVKRFALALYKTCRLCSISDDERRNGGSKKSLLSLADLQFAMAESDELWHATSDLAAMLAEDDPMEYNNRNIEANWISETARLLQKNNVALDWI